MTVPTLPGVTATTVTTPGYHRVPTTGPTDGIPVLFLHGNVTSATWSGRDDAGPSRRVPGHRSRPARLRRRRPGGEDRCHPRGG